MSKLTAAAQIILGKLHRLDGSDAYVVQTGRGRFAIVVPTGQVGVGRHLTRWRAVNSTTLRGLFTAGLIEWPDGYVELDYVGRQRLDSGSGEVIRITEAGKAAIAR